MDGDRVERRDLEHVGGAMDSVVSRVLRRAGGAATHLLWTEWEDVSGPDWAGTRPSRLDEGMLLVAVPDGAAATRLRYAVSDLLHRIEARAGAGVVTAVRMKVRRS